VGDAVTLRASAAGALDSTTHKSAGSKCTLTRMLNNHPNRGADEVYARFCSRMENLFSTDAKMELGYSNSSQGQPAQLPLPSDRRSRIGECRNYWQEGTTRLLAASMPAGMIGFSNGSVGSTVEAQRQTRATHLTQWFLSAA
jgi:hypothetical protein